MNQAVMDPSLENLLNLSAAVQQTANPVVPSTGQPTVASQMAQQAQKMAQPQQAPQPPAGIENLLPGVGVQAAQMAQQPATQAQMMAAQQQMQQQMQQMQQMQQRPQGMASGGIARLPVNFRMAEGGVVGYAGPEGSHVTPRTYGYAPDYEDARRFGINLSPYDSPEVRREKLERLARMKEFEEQRQGFGEIPTEASVARDRTIEMAYADPSRGRDVVRPVMPRQVSREQNMPTRNEAPPMEQPSGMPTQFDVGITALPALRRASQMVGGQEREDLLAKIAELESQQQSRSFAPSQQSASLMDPPMPSGSEQQFAQALSLNRSGDVGRARTPEQIRAETEAVYRARGIEPGKAEQERLAKLEAFDLQEEAERKKRIQQRGMQDLIQFLSSFGGAPSMVEGGRRGMAASAQLQQSWERSDEAYNLLKRQRIDAITAERTAIANRNRALADGDIATAAKEAEAIRVAQNARVDTEAKMRADYAARLLTAETSEKQMRSSEQIAEMNRRAQEALRNLPTPEQQMARQAIQSWMSQNPGSTFADAWEWYRGTSRPTDRSVLTYAQAAKIVDDRLSEYTVQFALKKEEEAAAKREGRQPRNLAQMREDLIRKELSAAGGTTGSPAPASMPLPPGVTVKRIGQ